MKPYIELAKKTFTEWNNHDAPRMGAALAFYSVLSLAPLVILVVGICALVFGAAGAQAQILEQFRSMVGNDGARAIEAVLKSAQKPATGVIASIIGLLMLLFGASGVFVELRAALNKLWDADAENIGSGIWSFIKDRFLSVGMVLAIGFLLLVSLAISAGLGAAGKFFASLGFLPPVIWEVVNFVVSLGVVAGLFALILRYIPNVRLPWLDIAMGSVLTAVLFTIGKTAIGVYLGKAGVGSAYGAAGSLVVLVVWVYYSAQIFFFGAMFTRVFAKSRGWHHQEVASRKAQDVVVTASNHDEPVKSPVSGKQEESASFAAKIAAAGLVIATLFGRRSARPHS